MAAIVVNRLHLSVPVDALAPTVEQEFGPVFRTIDGFEHFYVVKTDVDRCVVIIVWRDEAAATAGAEIIGPTLFATHLAPILAEPQDRVVGSAVVDVGAA